jgi:hypothetical protein
MLCCLVLGEEAESESRIRGVLKRPWADLATEQEAPLRATSDQFKTLHADHLTSMEAKAAEKAAAADEAGEEAAVEGEEKATA